MEQKVEMESGYTTARQSMDNSSHEGYSFAGRLGGNQLFTLDRHDEATRKLLAKEPDAAPGMSLKEQFDLRPFRTAGLWKAAIVEGVGTMLLVFLTGWANLSLDVLPEPFTARYGPFNNAAYLGPAFGGLSNFLILTLFTFAFGVVTGAHLNPTITLATFVAKLTSLPRAVLYTGFQLCGATIGGLFLRAGIGNRDFKVGGCWLFPDIVPVGDAFAIEFVACTALLFFAFGVGLDPRQRKIIPPALAPFLVGLSLGTISWMTGYTRYGYGGASMNPARCFGTFVGSRFPYWHWMHWVADLCACLCMLNDV